KRQKIAVARKAGKKEDQAGDLQGGPVVRKCRDVDRDCRPPEGSTAGSGAHSARKGPGRLSGARSPEMCGGTSRPTKRRRNLSSVCSGEDGQLGSQRPCRDVGVTIIGVRLSAF